MHGIAYLGLNKVLKIRKGPGRFLRLAQAAEVKLELTEPLHVQVDGEPWLQPPGTFTISLAGKSNVLVAPTRSELKEASKRPTLQSPSDGAPAAATSGV